MKSCHSGLELSSRSAAEAPDKYQSDIMIQITNLAASKLSNILQKYALSDTGAVSWSTVIP